MTTQLMSTETVVDAPRIANRIVVGVDESAAATAALRWAVGQARLSGAEVEAVYVYSPGADLAYAFGSYPLVTLDAATARESASAALDAAVRRALGDDAADVRRTVVEEGSPSRALTRAAGGASMLVVGAHQHHGLGLLLGSTASSCVRHATGPVVVVPAG